MGTGHDTHLSLSGLTVLHRSLLSAHLTRAGLVQAAPWFIDTHVSIDDLAGLGADQWEQIDEVLQRFASEYQGTLTGTEFARVRDDLSELRKTVTTQAETYALSLAGVAGGDS